MSNSKVTKNRKIGALVAYTTLACSLVSLGVYVYRQQKKSSSPTRGSDQNSRQSQDNGTPTHDHSTEVGNETDQVRCHDANCFPKAPPSAPLFVIFPFRAIRLPTFSFFFPCPRVSVMEVICESPPFFREQTNTGYWMKIH